MIFFRLFQFAAMIALAATAVFGQTTPAEQQPPKITTAPEQKPGTPMLPYSPSLDLTSMDKNVDPCADFYAYSCNGWVAKNPIPGDQASWSVYGKLYNDNLQFMRGILEEAAAGGAKRNATDRLIGDLYGSCMDEAAVEKAGLTPVRADLDAISKLKTTHDLAPLIARLHLASTSSGMLFGFGSTQNPEDSEQVIAFTSQGGIGLPDRDYYVKDDDRSKEVREKYVAHVQRMFGMLGDPPEAAKKNAETVMHLETELAKNSWTRVERRDPYKTFNLYTRDKLMQETPSFDWAAYFRAAGLPATNQVNVTTPQYLKEVEKLLKSEPLENWKTYLRWHLINMRAPFLGKDFVQGDFDFYQKFLRGVKEMRPRWKRCVQYVDDNLGHALGQAYVAKAFSPALKKKTNEMVDYIKQRMEAHIKSLDWMGAETKKQALEKLHGVRNKVGYPDKWIDYSRVKIEPGRFARNMMNAITFESHRQLNKIGKPVDKGEWGMTPPTVNAYYDSQLNDINFPAGVLQPPLYDPKLDDAPNYGNTGSTVGHELIHGFDDEGSQFDAKGNLRNWWTKEDRERFDQRTQCVADQYAQYTIIDDIKINSKLTLGEDVADLAGTILAFEAWKEATKSMHLTEREGFTPEQRFFIGFAQWDCNNIRPEELRVRARTDPHSPGRYRINGVVVNMPEFQKAFGCKAGEPMVKENRCVVW